MGQPIEDQANGYFDGTQKNRQPLESVHLETLLHNAESSLAFAKAHLSQSEVAITALRNALGH